MNARSIYPQGWHFLVRAFVPDPVTLVAPLVRIDHPVRYYFVDYGLSHRFLPDQLHLVLDWGGRDTDVPEPKKLQPYNASKVDVFTGGNVFSQRALPGICALTRVAHPSDQALLEMPCIRISCRPYQIHNESQPRNTAQCGEATSDMAQN